MNLRFRIRLHTGQVESLNIESDRVLVGSGAHCEIRLNIDQAQPEHIRIDVVPQGVYATALSFEPPPTINGVPFTQAPIPPDAVLGVGGTQLQVQAAESLQTSAQPVNQLKVSPSVLILCLITAAASATLYIKGDSTSKGNMPDPPDLWGAAVAGSCPQPGGEMARAMAYERLAMAESKRERRAFYPRDGVQAVPEFERASACFTAAGDAKSALYCTEAARALREETLQDFHKFRERLRYHYNQEEWGAARYDLRNLLAITETVPGPYRDFLEQLERDISRRGGQTP